MKILAIGDLVGENAVIKLKKSLEKIKQENTIDFIIANGENIAGGMGITEHSFKEILSIGIDVVTMGIILGGKKKYLVLLIIQNF